MAIIDKYLVKLPKALCLLIYSYFSSMTRLLISSLYNPMDDDIDMKIQNILTFQVFSFFTSLFYNTFLDVLNYSIRSLDTDKILIVYIKHKKASPRRCLIVIVYWRIVWY